MGSFSYAAYSTAKAVMVALFYVLFFGLGFDFRQNPRILAVIAIHAERENHCNTKYRNNNWLKELRLSQMVVYR